MIIEYRTLHPTICFHAQKYIHELQNPQHISFFNVLENACSCLKISPNPSRHHFCNRQRVRKKIDAPNKLEKSFESFWINVGSKKVFKKSWDPICFSNVFRSEDLNSTLCNDARTGRSLKVRHQLKT